MTVRASSDAILALNLLNSLKSSKNAFWTKHLNLQHLTFKQAPLPSDLNWGAICKSAQTKKSMLLTMVVVIILLLIVCCFLLDQGTVLSE